MNKNDIPKEIYIGLILDPDNKERLSHAWCKTPALHISEKYIHESEVKKQIKTIEKIFQGAEKIDEHYIKELEKKAKCWDKLKPRHNYGRIKELEPNDYWKGFFDYFETLIEDIKEIEQEVEADDK